MKNQNINESSKKDVKEDLSPSESLGEVDIPTDEVAAAVDQIKEDVTQSLHQTEQQFEESVQSFKQNFMNFINNYPTESEPLMRRQKATSIQWWHDFNHEPTIAKLLLCGLLTTNVVFPMFFLNYRESWFVLFTYFCVSALSHFLYQMTPARSPDRFTTSLLSHLLWVPLLFWLSSRVSSYDLVSQKASMEHVDVFLTLSLSRGKWITAFMRSVLTMNSIALFCDVIKMLRVLQGKILPKSNHHQGHAHIQTKPHLSVLGKQALIDNSQDDAINRQQHQEGIKQRLRSTATAPTA